LKVIRLRQSLRVGIGAGGKPALERAIRIHGNFAEYIPLALLLLLFMELQGRAHWLIHILCLALIAARLVHAYGVGQENEDIRLRTSAVTTTFVILGIAALSGARPRPLRRLSVVLADGKRAGGVAPMLQNGRARNICA
jgi:uncharacterized membrane protein YecN with MAPEG domain